MIHSVPAPSFSGETEVTVPEAISDVVLTEGAVVVSAAPADPLGPVAAKPAERTSDTIRFDDVVSGQFDADEEQVRQE